MAHHAEGGRSLELAVSGRQSQAVALAVRLVRDRGYTVTAAAKHHGLAVSSVRRALRAAGVEPLRRGRPKPEST
ncbi:helix-turn-helix domain-containing protein [Ramlibacter sp.]|uniref:helix-turn-helix domain-containing protein n=1 Tax=Ramlibacter sp. TaxID=1917967 RepID=UPI003D0AA648